MALSARLLVSRLPTFVSKAHYFASSNLRPNIEAVSAANVRPLYQKSFWFSTISDSEPEQAREGLILTEACVKRLKKIGSDDDTYLRVLVRLLCTSK